MASRVFRPEDWTGGDLDDCALVRLVADDCAGAAALLATHPAPMDVDATGVVETQWTWLRMLAPLIGRVAGRDASAPTAWSWTAHAVAIDRLDVAAGLGAAGNAKAALAALAEADAALGSAPIIQLLARRLIGELAVRDGWADRTVELLVRASLVGAVQHGLTELASRGRAILRDGGFAIPRFGPSDAAVPVDLRASGLTAREMEVVELLAAGRTTTEAADALYISTTTVKTHVANAAKKLGYPSRRELLAGIAALQT
jgi:DNA-binding CsgD family transcriptional regulator